jgi:hypothetical protein
MPCWEYGTRTGDHISGLHDFVISSKHVRIYLETPGKGLLDCKSIYFICLNVL